MVDLVEAGSLAARLVGDAIGANLFLVGFAWQRGLLPLGRAAIERAIEVNGVQVELNRRAFLWGRRAAHDLAAVRRIAGGERRSMPRTLDELVVHRAEFLKGYQDEALARRYRERVERVRAVEARVVPGRTELTEAVARGLFKLTAVKDEYEVARLWTDGAFLRQLGQEFASWRRLELHLAPPFLARRNPVTGHPRKRRFGPWMLRAMRLLVPLRRWRGTSLDPFGRTTERRMERALLARYETTLDEILARLNPQNHGLATELAAVPERIRGFGHVKAASVKEAEARWADLLAALRGPEARLQAAE
jgi:indolepyruvate ferredoxin oxidoreductase